MKPTTIPSRMSHLELDPRGYAIPWGVFRDDSGRAHFQINDDRRRYQAIKNDLCPICGGSLFRGRWFVGGPISAFHKDGSFADPPMHHECATYSLQVCPYLAVPYYGKRLDDKTLKGKSVPLLADNTMIERRPNVFICAMATRQRVTKGIFSHITPVRPYSQVEYWQHGQQLNQTEGEALVKVDQLTWEREIANVNRNVKLIVPVRGKQS
jgi:hypothetical protein